MTSYCSYVREHPQDLLNREYHDTQYGFPLEDEARLFERLVLEINQAGLSWNLILKRAPQFRRAYQDFDVDKVAAFDELDVARLLADAGIIRNRLKVKAAIENARRIRNLREAHGSFGGWLMAHHPRPLEAWVTLFKKTVVFMGPEIVNEFLISTGFLPGAHERDCPVFAVIAGLRPAWMGDPKTGEADSGRM